jgi:hypothetical protein
VGKKLATSFDSKEGGNIFLEKSVIYTILTGALSRRK